MTAAEQHQAAHARLFAPSGAELQQTIREGAGAFAATVGGVSTRAQVDGALATLEGLRRYLLRLRELVPEVAG